MPKIAARETRDAWRWVLLSIMVGVGIGVTWYVLWFVIAMVACSV